MKAELKPLDGKYYGTEVSITKDGDDPGDFGEGLIQIWVMGNWEPSKRELEGYPDEYGDDFEICDSHYETETGLEIAELLVEAVNTKYGD
jgi:hypothetical protein